MKDLRNNVVVITGAASGLGKALAAEFFRQGCHLALIDINPEGLQEALKEFNPAGTIVTVHQADVSNEQSIITTRLSILAKHHHVDILVNNAGVSISQTFEQIDLADYKKVFDINFWGTIYCSKHFLPDLKQRQDSRLVNIISDFALMGFPAKTAYASSKSAVLGFTNSLKTELDDHKIKVCYVVPPPLDTDLVKNGKHIDEKKKESEAKFLQRNGLPLDKAARRIVKQIGIGRYRIIVGIMMFGMDVISRLFPTTLHNLIAKNKRRFDFI